MYAIRSYYADGEYDRMVSMGGEDGVVRIGQMQADPVGLGFVTGGGNQMMMSYNFV